MKNITWFEKKDEEVINYGSALAIDFITESDEGVYYLKQDGNIVLTLQLHINENDVEVVNTGSQKRNIKQDVLLGFLSLSLIGYRLICRRRKV